MGEVDRPHHSYRTGIEDVWNHGELVVREVQSFHILGETAEVGGDGLYAVVVEIERRKFNIGAESVDGLHVVVCHVEQGELNHLRQRRRRGKRLEIVVAEIHDLYALSHGTFGQTLPVGTQLGG